MKKEKTIVLVIDDMVIFPNNEVRIEYDNIFDKNFVDILENTEDENILIVNPLDEDFKSNVTSLPGIGILGNIKLKINVPNNKTRVVIEGLKRVKIFNYLNEDKCYKADYEEIEQISSEDEQTYSSILIKYLNNYIDKIPHMGNAIVSQLNKVNNLSDLTDLITSFISLDYNRKKKYIEIIDPVKRAKLLIEDMKEDLKIAEIEQRIEIDIEKQLSDNQKEYFIREKIKALQKELGEKNTKEDEILRIKKKFSKLKCNPKIKDRIKREISRYEALNSNSPELGIIRDYLDWLLNLPWEVLTKDNSDLSKVKNILDTSHYGLEKVKNRILEYLAVKQNTNNSKSPIICLVGPPGVGKTSLALSIAKSLNRKVAKISVGGINDEAEIIGHRRTYIGASPGRIIQGIRKAGSKNPVFIIDEIDKMTKDIKGDPASALLEVLDKEQNDKFSDHYIEEEFDLSKVMFIATANYIEQIPYELKDRLEIINLSSYTEYEKFYIAKTHLVPKKMEEHGLTPLQVQVTDEAIMSLIRNYTREAGVRELERMLEATLRKIVKSIFLDKNLAFYKVDEKMLEKLLGKPKYSYTKSLEKMEPGVVNGLAYTVFGGDVLQVEATYYKGKGNLVLTGSLGEVMEESCQIALSYIKANAQKFGIDNKILNENDIHIHFPEGAVEKDGPSAGITITTTLISLFTNKKVSKDLAMTGEITLRGRVLPIGGLKEKAIGASRSNIKTIILPLENKKDLDEIPKEIVKSINFIFVENYIDVYNELFKTKKLITA